MGSTELVTTAIDNQSVLWVFAVVLYGVGDTITTLIGLRSDSATEGGPVARFVLRSGGIPGFLLLKSGIIGTYLLVWWLLRTPVRVAIPLALVVVGTVVTGWNLVVITT